MHDDDIVHGAFARRLIGRKVRLLAQRPDFAGQQPEDIEQDLYVFLLLALPLFDPERAHINVFLKTVIERAVARMIRDRKAKKRNGESVCSLDALRQKSGAAAEPADPRSNEHGSDLALDVADLMSQLPGELRDLAERLTTQTVAEIAIDLDLAQSTVWRRVRRLREEFEDAGLRKYL